MSMFTGTSKWLLQYINVLTQGKLPFSIEMYNRARKPSLEISGWKPCSQDFDFWVSGKSGNSVILSPAVD